MARLERRTAPVELIQQLGIESQQSQYPNIKHSNTLIRILANRGIQSLDKLNYGLEKLPHFSALKDINRAAQRIGQAILRDEGICVVGDFDADGATSVALLMKALKAMGANQLSYLVPNRFTDGYGLSPALVQRAHEKGAQLIITVDNGMGSFAAAAKAQSLGVNIIITDHHLAAEQLPDVYAIVNPNQPGCTFESKAIAGVGVAFYVLIALRNWFREHQPEHKAVRVNLAQWLDLVAVGTISDVVPLDYINRIFVYQGMARIQQFNAGFGIQALAEVSSRPLADLQAQDVGFTIGPRINAAGRLDDMELGIECLLAESYDEALEKAKTLQVLNLQRRSVEQDMRAEANLLLDEFLLDDSEIPPILSLYQADWHSGVVGILAGRLKEKYHRPVIVFARESDHDETGKAFIKGSGRSIPGLHMRDLLERVSHIVPGVIEKFGGHAMAAGLTIVESEFESFNRALLKAMNQMAKPALFEQIIWTDGRLEPEDFCLDFLYSLRSAGPWGQDFPEPLFDGVFRVLDERWLKEEHLKLVLEIPGTSIQIDALAFFAKQAAWHYDPAEYIQIAYRLNENTFRGATQLQLLIEYIWPVHSQD